MAQGLNPAFFHLLPVSPGRSYFKSLTPKKGIMMSTEKANVNCLGQDQTYIVIIILIVQHEVLGTP